MGEINEKYYSGFEGEPEIIFYIEKSDGSKSGIGVWVGYFNSIIKQIKPNEGRWTSLAYYYHLDIGWYEESPWLIVNLEEAYEQLREINKEDLTYEEDKVILNTILNMFRQAIDKSYKMYISYE
jgi:hypothetical protein